MGVRIRSTGIATDNVTFSSIGNGGRAARHCLDRAQVRSDQVGVLINVGVFRDSNMVEPAMSALIQKSAGIGLDYEYGDPRTFSFDLMNGAVGVINAVQVAQSILETESAGHVMIVAGDTHPSMERSIPDDEFPYASAGAALLLEHTTDPESFGQVHTASGEGDPAVEAYVDVSSMGSIGRTLMTVDRSPDFDQRLLEVACRAGIAALQHDDTVDPATTVLIASTPTADFPRRVADKLGLSAIRTPNPAAGDLHTAALPLAYDLAVQEDSLSGFEHILFVAAGAGPGAAAVLYRLPAPAGQLE